MRICTICIRAGSKGLPGKNWRMLHGQPLFVHSVNQAISSGQFDRIVISTDSSEVKQIAANLPIDLVVDRKLELAIDESGKVPAIVDAVSTTEKYFMERYQTCVDLDATAPLREVSDIVKTIELLESTESSSIITGCQSRRSPYFNMVRLTETDTVEICIQPENSTLRRQDAPITYDMNASIYAWKRDALISEKKVFFSNTKIYEMPHSRSIDIDSELDFQIVEFLMSKKDA